MDLALLIVTCVINIGLGLVIFYRDTERLYARRFLLMSVVISVWIISNFLTNHYYGSLGLVDAANRIAFMSGYGVVVAGLLFTYSFPISRSVSTPEKIIVGLLIGITILLSSTTLVAGEVSLADGELSFSNGSFAWFYIASFLTVLIMLVRNLLILPRASSNKIRQQAHIILVAFLFSALAGLTLNLLIPLVASGWHTTRLGPVSTAFLVGVIAYAIVRHGLFDIRTAVIRTVAYVLSLGTLSFIYFMLAYFASITLFEDTATTGFSTSPVNIALALLLAFIFQPVKQFFDKTTNKIFYRGRYDTDDFIARISGVLTTTTDLRALLHRAASEIGSTLKAEQTFFYVRYNHSHRVTAGTTGHASITDEEFSAIVQYSKKTRQSVIVAEIVEIEEIRNSLDKHRIAIVMPLFKDGESIGMLALGYQRTNHYTNRDVKVLGTIADELVIAIQNSLSIQEVKDINIHLQQRIEEATLELRHSNNKLKEIDKSKDEFISMASHQLRTPLTAVKGYISMVLEEDMGKITKGQREVLEQAFDSSQRMVFLIGDFLNVSRLQTGKFVLEPSQINFTKLVGEEVDQLVDTARIRNITLNYEKPSMDYMSIADDNKIRQVMMNFIDNAIFYSPSGSRVDIQLFKDEGGIIFKVKDRGIGVPKAEQAKLFTKFFRAGNARQQRPDGTGIGIYMAKKVILAHGGTIIFETKEGEGSTFGFRLPLENDPNQLGKQPDATASHTKHDSTKAR